jgi:hypothetical protein
MSYCVNITIGTTSRRSYLATSRQFDSANSAGKSLGQHACINARDGRPPDVGNSYCDMLEPGDRARRGNA